MLDLLIPAILVLAGYVWLVLRLNRTFQALRKERFERTNEAGIAEFANFEEMRAFEKREGRNGFLIAALAVPGGIVPLVAIFIIFASFMMAIS